MLLLVAGGRTQEELCYQVQRVAAQGLPLGRGLGCFLSGCLQAAELDIVVVKQVWSPETAAVTRVFLAAAKDGTAGAPNLQLHDVKTGKCLKSFIQKKMQNW